MAAGSVTGTVLGGLLLGVIPDVVLVPFLAGLLLLSSVKVGGTPWPDSGTAARPALSCSW